MEAYSYGATPEQVILAAAERECPNGSYPIEAHEGSEDFTALQDAVNQGIDSHLEAVRFEEFNGKHGRRGFRFDTETLHVLCRRLGESEDENANSLRVGILETLGIEEV